MKIASCCCMKMTVSAAAIAPVGLCCCCWSSTSGFLSGGTWCHQQQLVHMLDLLDGTHTCSNRSGCVHVQYCTLGQGWLGSEVNELPVLMLDFGQTLVNSKAGWVKTAQPEARQWLACTVHRRCWVEQFTLAFGC